jgi:hypothetical protein
MDENWCLQMPQESREGGRTADERHLECPTRDFSMRYLVSWVLKSQRLKTWTLRWASQMADEFHRNEGLPLVESEKHWMEEMWKFREIPSQWVFACQGILDLKIGGAGLLALVIQGLQRQGVLALPEYILDYLPSLAPSHPK